MKQDTLRKLKHRILAGMLCFSIIFAAQPNRLNASGFLEEVSSEETALYEEPEGTVEYQNSEEFPEESYEVSTEDSFEKGSEDALEGDTKNASEEEKTTSTESDGGSDALTEEDLYEYTDQNTLRDSSMTDTEDDSISDSEDAGEESPLETSAVPEPQTVGTHQHSISVDCSVSEGEQVSFTELNQTFTGGVMSEGNYYLSEDVTLSSSVTITSGTVKLCLNDHTLQYTGTSKARVFEVSNDASLYICDCGTNGTITGGTESGIYVNQGHLKIYGGNISGNTARSGGGIYLTNSTIEMYGGKISDNIATSSTDSTYGGGVYISGTSAFKMHGGSISNNKTNAPNFSSAGGGIYISENTTFEMNGGEIADNYLNGRYQEYGGGVYNNGIFIMNNGIITNNSGLNGGGIYSTGELQMLNGTITNNIVHKDGHTGSGGGVYISGGSFIMKNGKIINHDNGGGVHVSNKSNFIMDGGEISYNCSSSGGGVYLRRESSFEMNGGEISHNSAKDGYNNDGGGVSMVDNVTFTMNGGKISNNSASTGGGVYNGGGPPTSYGLGAIGGDSYFIMNNGTISDNTAETGGGLYITAGSNASEKFDGIFQMNGGVIQDNIAASLGGGVYVTSKLNISGGTISGNTADNIGGGIYMMQYGTITMAQMEVSGSPNITNNKQKDNIDNNVYISKDLFLTISSPLTQGAKIGVTHVNGTMSSSGPVGGTVTVTNTPFAKPAADEDIHNYAQYFSSDVDGYGVLYRNDIEKGLYLGDGITITYDYARNGGNSVTLASAFVEKNTTFDLSPDASNAVTAGKDGWEFLGWNTDPDATDVLDTLAVKEENITLYAIYKKTLTASFYSGNGNQKLEKTITIYNNKTEGIVTAPALEALPGWTALGWDRNRNRYEGKIRALSDIRLTEDCDFYGIYQQPITISYDANGGAAAPAGETKDRYANVHNTITYQNPVVTLAPAVSRTGYTFNGWHQGSSTGMVKRPGTEVELTGNTTFYADWRADTDRSYVVEHYWQDVTGDGYTLMDTIPCTGTVDTEAEAEARAYTGLTENAGHPSRKASGIIAADGSLVLKLYYDRDTYTVSFDLNGGEGTAPEAQVIRYGGNVKPVPAPTRDGYAFTGWYTERETDNGIQWNFAATVEDNERNRSIDSYTAGIGRSIQNTDVILYAGWEKNAVNMEPANPGTDTPTDSSSTQTVINNTVSINNSNPASGKPVPGTGDTAPIELYATAAMIAGLSYLLLELADERGMTEEKKRELTARLVQWARKGGSCRKVLAVIAMFLLLAYYHGIGKQISAKSIHVKRLSDSESV